MLTEIIYQDIALRLLTDVIGMLVLVGALFYRNYRRIDFVAVFMACNIGLFSVLTVLASSEISAAIGFGLFGVLSIIRLRSSEYNNIHIAYFFISIAIALVTSLETHPLALSIVFVTLLVGVMAVFDTGSLRQKTSESELILDQLFVDQDLLKAHLEKTLNCTVIAMEVNAINYLNETTRVTLSYRINKSQA